MFNMNKWLTRIGITLIVIALVLVSPLMDFVPVDWRLLLVDAVDSILGKEQKHVYFKLVATEKESNNFYIYALITIGIILLAFGKFYKPKAEKQ